VQRLLDLILSSLAILILMPILIIVMIFLRVTGEGEIFFSQDRLGINGNYFKLLKFATMKKNSPNIGTGTVTIKNDPRILPFGRFLRITKINELPQLFNVIRGDMSLVGPRPLTNEAFSLYDDNVKTMLGKVRPGLSGVGSIIFRNEESILDSDDSLDFFKEVIMPYKGKLEVWFIQNRNISIYFLTIFLTLYVVFFSNSRIVWSLFNNLPEPPSELKKLIY
tara:strand:- start:128 stop:793 length:666 start_codon:yes stop_codon:yes gene_type:complete